MENCTGKMINHPLFQETVAKNGTDMEFVIERVINLLLFLETYNYGTDMVNCTKELTKLFSYFFM